MTRSLHCVISGKVQGVGFRAWTKDIAEKFGIKGWVRNLNDGRVEVLAQGDEKKIEEFKGKLTQGPVLSRVDDIECKYIDYEKEFTRFELRL
jgi:acylphosphatase